MFSPDFEFKALFLTNRIIQSFLREKMNIWNDMMYVHKLRIVNLEPIDIEFISHFYDALNILMGSTEEFRPFRSECIQGLLRSAILGLCGVLKKMMPAEEAHPHQSSTSLFQKFLDLVNNNQDKTHTVEDYASMLCISPKYLTVVCKKNSGKTANEWIREHILEEIRFYLKQTDMSIKQIADRLGFANPSFFGKYVKEHFGMTPVQFRAKG